MTDERRNSGRHDIEINMTYFFDDGSSFKIAQSVNVNKKGMAIRVDRILHQFSNINFMIEGIQETFEAQVVWCKREPIVIGEQQQYTCGISYKDVIAERVNEILKQLMIDSDSIKPGTENGPS